jgi:hypothetical protein
MMRLYLHQAAPLIKLFSRYQSPLATDHPMTLPSHPSQQWFFVTGASLEIAVPVGTG